MEPPKGDEIKQPVKMVNDDSVEEKDISLSDLNFDDEEESTPFNDLFNDEDEDELFGKPEEDLFKDEPEKKKKKEKVEDLFRDEPEKKETKVAKPTKPVKYDEISISDLDNTSELQSKLSKTLLDLQNIKDDMKNTFTSTDTISSTIVSVKGIIDALRKDQLQIQEGMKNQINESILKNVPIDPIKNVQFFIDQQEKLIQMGKEALKLDPNASPKMVKQIEAQISMSEEFLKRAKDLIQKKNLTDSLKDEMNKKYPNKTEEDQFVNTVWFQTLKYWNGLVAQLN